MTGGWTRRNFVEMGAAGVALVATGSFSGTTAFAAPEAASDDRRRQPWIEGSISELQRRMREGTLTSVQLTKGYLDRIAELNPVLNAIIEINPDALKIARRLDRERWAGHVRGPLHGLSVIVKDNIATDDDMETTAGSLALVGSEVPGDAPLIRQLRKAGAIILGKANLSEWANFRGFAPINGWTARGGFTRNPYDLGLDPCGSSSGSATAAAASLCTVAVGTETDGSVTCPSGEQSLVGMKPTVGLVSGTGIIPLAHSQDTAGPMARSVRDAALLLDAIRVPGEWVMGHRVPRSYTNFLDKHALHSVRLAYDRRYVRGDLGPHDDEVTAVLDAVVEQLRSSGADIVEVESIDPYAPDENGRIPGDDEFTALLFEFKVQIAEYLDTLTHTDMHTLADLIQFNRDHCDEELKWYGQEIFELAQATSGDLTDPEFLAATAAKQHFGKRVIDGFIQQGFDATIGHAFGGGTSPAATSGYPSIDVPVGYTPTGRPVGMLLSGGFMNEPMLFRIAYAIEQTLQARVPPTFTGSPSDDPPPFDGCAPTVAVMSAAASTEGAGHHAIGRHARNW